MGVIEDVYEEEELDGDVPFEKFEAAVEDKVDQMGGLADEETAAMLIAHELRDEEVGGIADIAPGMDEVKFLGKVTGIGEMRTFERDGDDEDGQVVNVEVADGSGSIRVAFWDDQAEAAIEELEVGTVLRIAGRPKEGYNGVEVNADRVEPDADAEVDVQVRDSYRVEDLSMGLSDVNLRGQVLDVDDRVRTFDRDDGSEGKVANLVLGDETGRIRVTLWDEQTELLDAFDPGDSVEAVDSYVREREGDLELHVGDRGTIDEIDETIEYVPETTDVADLELGETVDLAGGVIETDPKRTFDRDDGSEGQVRNVRIKDDTGDIRVALWGEKADADIDLGDYVVVTDVEIEDGWQDDLEASANWRSTISVLDEDPRVDAGAGAGGAGSDDRPGGADATADGGAADGSLSSFGGGDAADAGESTASAAADPGGSGTGDAGAGEAGAALADAEEVSFHGTVVQAGSPVVLDDGDSTRSVETDEEVRLGEEITVRGRLRDGRIHADELLR